MATFRVAGGSKKLQTVVVESDMEVNSIQRRPMTVGGGEEYLMGQL